MFYRDSVEKIITTKKKEKEKSIAMASRETDERRPEYTTAARKQLILEILNQNSEIRIADLSRQLNTSVVTIRKDLDDLEREGLLKRVRGGAILNYRGQNSAMYLDRMKVKKEEKMMIAAAAANLISDGDTVIINSGSTTLYCTQALRTKKNLIVITNAVQVFSEISYCRNITTFFLGGRFDPEIQATFGDDTNEQLSRYKADKLIIGMDGADIHAGATTYNYVEATSMRLMMKCAREKILVVDDSKIGRAALVRIGMLSEFDVIVTNYQPGLESEYDELRTMGVNVVAVRTG